MMKEEEEHYLYGREERDPRKRKRMSEEVSFLILIITNAHQSISYIYRIHHMYPYLCCETH